MAGRPRTKHKLVSELAERVSANCDALFKLMPAQYHGYFGSNSKKDPLREAWVAAAAGMATGWAELNALRKVLAVRAGIPDGGEKIVIDGTAWTLEEWAIATRLPKQLLANRWASGMDQEQATFIPPTDEELRAIGATPEFFGMDPGMT